MQLQGFLFDKDGTLFDYDIAWNAWAMDVLGQLGNNDAAVMARLANAIEFDLDQQRFFPTSPVIAGTNHEACALFAAQLPHLDFDHIDDILTQAAFRAPQSEVVTLVDLMATLRTAGLKTGVVTNDTEQGAHVHLSQVGAVDSFDFIAGFDSGFGAKPEPGPLLAFAKHVGLDPARVAMVGDSLHDLTAGRRAGMYCIGVLTGMATRDDLSGHADLILDHIGEIPQHFGISQDNFQKPTDCVGNRQDRGHVC